MRFRQPGQAASAAAIAWRVSSRPKDGTAPKEVDTAKVSKYVDSIAPKGGKWPDMGQGNRGSDKKPTGVAAGRAMWEAQHKKQ